MSPSAFNGRLGDKKKTTKSTEEKLNVEQYLFGRILNSLIYIHTQVQRPADIINSGDNENWQADS